MKDAVVNDHEGVFTDYQLSFWGESINPDIQELHPLPDIHDHDHETELATMIATTTVAGATQAATPTATPTGDKPSGAGPSATATSSSASGFSDNFLPSPFPTFGVSKSTQIWIYGSLALIIIFCATLGIYFYVQRRKRIRNNPRDDYEFEMVAAEDEAGLLAAGGASGARSGQRRRGGELYDAFAGDSEEEDEGMLSDSDRGVVSGSEEGDLYRDDEGSDHSRGAGAGTPSPPRDERS